MLVASSGAIVSVNRDGVRKPAGDRRPRRRLLARRDVHRVRPPRRPLARELGRQRAAPLSRRRRTSRNGGRAGSRTATLSSTRHGWRGEGRSASSSCRQGPSKADRREQRRGVRRAAASASGRLAFVSTRTGTPVVYAAQANGIGAAPFNSTVPTPAGDAVRGRARPRRGHPTRRSSPTPPTSRTARLLVVDDGTTQLTLPIGTRPIWSAGRNAQSRFADETGSLASVAADRNRSPSRSAKASRSTGGGFRSGRRRFPNLVQRAPSGLVVSASRSHWQLGFTSMVDNRGPRHPLDQGHPRSNAHMMDVRQLVQLGSRRDARRPASRPVALRRRSAALPLAHARLRPLRATECRRLQADGARSQERVLHRRPLRDRDRHTARPASLPQQLRAVRAKARYVEEGSSVGYTDRYPAFFHGQSIDITKVKAGRYWLVHRANPDFYLRETLVATTMPRRSVVRSRGTTERLASRRCAPACANAASSPPRPFQAGAADPPERALELGRDDPHLVRFALRDLRQGLQVLVGQELRIGVACVDRLEDGRRSPAPRPSAARIVASRWPSALQDRRLLLALGCEDLPPASCPPPCRIAARFSRSARICFSIDVLHRRPADRSPSARRG